MEKVKFLKKINYIKRAIPILAKTKKNDYLSKNGVNVKSVDINDMVAVLEPVFMEHGVLSYHFVENGEFVTKLIDEDSGESIQSAIPITNKDPQKVMAEMTYYRRGNYTNLLDLQAHNDDDGNLSSGNAILADTAKQLGKIKDIKKYLGEFGAETIKQITEEQGQKIVNQWRIDTFDSIATMEKIKAKLDELDLGKVNKAIGNMLKMSSHELDKEKKQKLVEYGKHLRKIADELSRNTSN